MSLNQYDITQASRTLKCLSNESRLKILFELSERSMSVSALNEQVKISQSALSQHLNMLKLACIIDSKRRGTQVTYSITSEIAGEVVRKLKELFKVSRKRYIAASENLKLNEAAGKHKR